MICKECNHYNPEVNRFCGGCGASLETEQTTPVAPPPRTGHTRQLWTPPASPVSNDQRIPEAATVKPTAIPEAPPVLAKREISIAPARTERPMARASSIGGQSFLGLGVEDDPPDAPVQNEFEYGGRNVNGGRDYNDAYKRDDLYRANWSGRILVVLVIIGIVGGLGWMQWQSQRPLKSSPASNNNGQASNQNSSSDLTSPAASPSTSELEKEQQAQAKTAQNAAQPQNSSGQDSSAAAPASPANKAAEKPTETAKGNTAKQDELAKNSAPSPETGKTNASGQTAVAESSKPAASPSPASSSTSTLMPSGKPAGAPEQNSDEPVRLAEVYLTGKGVPQNCDEALGILRTASNRGNARALIKLGALYATGNCVAMDRVAAYRYFTLASKNEPSNTWLEQSRSMLWANMSDAERKQAMEVER